MTAVFFTSDTHFLHEMVAGLRGFAATEEHDEAVIVNWNRAVRPDDLVWHLGDVGIGNETRILEQAARLNGRKQLITGNHDSCWPGNRGARSRQRRWMEVFESVQAFARIRIDGRPVLLSHFPYSGDHTAFDRHSQYRLKDRGFWLLHGHTHGRETLGPFALPIVTFGAEPIYQGRQLHVGVDAWGLHPVSEAAALEQIREREAGEAVTGSALIVACGHAKTPPAPEGAEGVSFDSLLQLPAGFPRDRTLHLMPGDVGADRGQ